MLLIHHLLSRTTSGFRSRDFCNAGKIKLLKSSWVTWLSKGEMFTWRNQRSKVTVVEQNGNKGYTQYIPAPALSICSNFVRIILYKRSRVEPNYSTILFLPGHGGRVLSYYWSQLSRTFPAMFSAQKRHYNIITLNTLTSECIFSLLFSIHFLRCWQGEFVS